MLSVCLKINIDKKPQNKLFHSHETNRVTMWSSDDSFQLEAKESKLSSSMNSIKTFWSPELKKERALRKDEVSKMSMWKEQYRVVQDETQVSSFSSLFPSHDFCNTQVLQQCTGWRPLTWARAAAAAIAE